MDKPVSVRLPDTQIRELMALAVLDDVSLAELLRQAVIQYLEDRAKDPDIKEKAEMAKRRQAGVLEALNRQ